MLAPRVPWLDFPNAYIHTAETFVKQHPGYRAAKSGDADAAGLLAAAACNETQVLAMAALMSDLGAWAPTLVSAHAYESDGVNAIPQAFADLLGRRLGWPVDDGILQVNVVTHTGADGWSRMARPAAFDGAVETGRSYVLVDDFLGMGGTLASLRGHIESLGGVVWAATTLTGKPYSAKLSPTIERLRELRTRHGPELEAWWQHKFGYAFDSLTESEARYLARTADVDTIRNRLAAAEQARNHPAHG